MMNTNDFVVMSQDEMMAVNGGYVGWVLMGCVAFGIGYYLAKKRR